MYSYRMLFTPGSAFTITIPQKVVNVDPVGNFREKYKKGIESAEQEKEIFRAKDAHILVVDDTKMNLMVIEGLLRDTGIQIDTALSGMSLCPLDEMMLHIVDADNVALCTALTGN